MTSNLTQHNFISSSSGQKSQVVSLGQNPQWSCVSLFQRLQVPAFLGIQPHCLTAKPAAGVKSSPPAHFDPPQFHSLNRTHVNILGPPHYVIMFASSLLPDSRAFTTSEAQDVATVGAINLPTPVVLRDVNTEGMCLCPSKAEELGCLQDIWGNFPLASIYSPNTTHL